MMPRSRMLLSIVGFVAVTATARASFADCASQLAPLFTAGGAHVKMTISTADASKWVSYSDGYLKFNGGGYLTAQVDQLFSDRMVYAPNSFIGQPFNIGAADHITPYVGSTGMIWIYNNTWGGWTSYQATCANGFVYGFIDGAMVNMALAPWTPPPPPR